jgi:hypothetical protein
MTAQGGGVAWVALFFIALAYFVSLTLLLPAIQSPHVYLTVFRVSSKSGPPLPPRHPGLSDSFLKGRGWMQNSGGVASWTGVHGIQRFFFRRGRFYA